MDKNAGICDFAPTQRRGKDSGLVDYREGNRDALAPAFGSESRGSARRSDGSARLARSEAQGSGERRSRSTRPDENPAVADKQQSAVFGVFVAMMIAMTVFQKIGYAPNKTFGLPLIVPIAYAALGLGVLIARPVFRAERMILFLAVMTLSTLSNILFARQFSLTSLLLYIVLYLPFLVAFDTTRATYMRCLNFFSTTMLVFAAVVWVQHAIQFTIGWTYWPDLDKLVPRQFLVPDFLYIQPIEWGTALMKPSGIVFLEVSFLSQFLAFALLMELLFLQRSWRAIFFGATLFATFAGTGLVLLLVSLPIVFSRMNARTFAILLATAFFALFIALQLHWFDMVAHRVGEFQDTGSSANSRFIAPLDRIRAALTDESGVYAGIGAGQIERGGNIFWWPIVKTTVEFGLIQGILFYVFFVFSLFDRTPSRQLAFVLIIWFSFEATLLTPLNPLFCVMVSTMFAMRDEKRPRRQPSGRSDGGGSSSRRPDRVATAAG